MTDQKKGQIESEKVVVLKVFQDFWFSIPDYQRSYVWGKDEISELISDVSYASERSPGSQYFLGSMVLHKDTGVPSSQEQHVKYEVHNVLDGQQRLTTLFLMIAVIRDLTPDDELGKALRDTCQGMVAQKLNFFMGIPDRTRIVYPLKEDVDEFIEQFVRRNNGTSKSTELDDKEKRPNRSVSNMAKAIRLMRDYFGECTPQQRAQFARYLFNNALFIYVSTEDVEDAFRLFTILNARGMPLSSADILKARNLGAVENKNERTKWAKFWDAMEGEFDEADEFDRFLSFVRTIYVKDKQREGLVKEFYERVYSAKPKPLLDLGTSTFQAVKSYKTAYDEAILLNPSPGGLGDQYQYQSLINVMRRTIPSKDWIPPLLAWYNKFKTMDLLKFLKRLDNKFSADWIDQLTPTVRIKNMNDVLNAIDKAEKPASVLAEAGIFDYDKLDLLRALDEDIYGRPFALYILLRLEYLYLDPSIELGLRHELSVEHIIPQQPKSGSQWSRDFNDQNHEHWCNKLGNLMLLTRRKNAELGNLDFAEKKAKYFKAKVGDLPSSLRVLLLPEFNLETVVKRHNELLAKLKASY